MRTESANFSQNIEESCGMLNEDAPIDDQTLKGYHARVLLADALANPAERATLLPAAMERIDAAPPSIKRLKWVVRIRDEIARELKK